MLQIKNIHKRKNRIKLVDGVSFEAVEKKITALTGPNGSGKTTLLDIITGLDKADQGKIIFNKMNIINLSPYKRVKLGISRIFAEPKLFLQKTVLENMLLTFDESHDHFWKALFRFKTKNTVYYQRKLKIEKILQKSGLQAQESDKAESLSILQRKLLAIAMILVKEPSLIVCDELSSGLDKEGIVEIKKILDLLRKEGKTILLADQHLDFILDISDKIIVLNAGEEIAMGTPSKIRANKKVLEAYNN